MTTFADRLRDVMTRQSVGVSLLVLKSGLSHQGIYRLLAGEREPSWATVQALATALKVSTEEFRDVDATPRI